MNPEPDKAEALRSPEFLPGLHICLDGGEEWSLVGPADENTAQDDVQGRLEFLPGLHICLDGGEEDTTICPSRYHDWSDQLRQRLGEASAPPPQAEKNGDAP